MSLHLKTLGAGVLALVGLLVLIAVFITQPAWIVPVGLIGTLVAFAVLMVVSRG